MSFGEFFYTNEISCKPFPTPEPSDREGAIRHDTDKRNMPLGALFIKLGQWNKRVQTIQRCIALVTISRPSTFASTEFDDSYDINVDTQFHDEITGGLLPTFDSIDLQSSFEITDQCIEPLTDCSQSSITDLDQSFDSQTSSYVISYDESSSEQTESNEFGDHDDVLNLQSKTTSLFRSKDVDFETNMDRLIFC